MMHQQRISRRSSLRKPSRPLRRPRLGLETLESRHMLAADVVITEVMYGITGSDNGKEYVELYNAGDMSISLNSWKLTDDAGNILYTLPATTLLADSYLLIASGTNNFSAVSNKVGPTIDWSAGGLGNNDSAILKDQFNNVMAELDYGNSDPWPERANSGGSSLQIIDRNALADDRYRQSNWMASREVDGSPGEAGITTSADVVINEVLGNSGLALQDQIELYNLTDKEINISGWYFRDGSASNDLLSPPIPNGTTIAPYGTISFNEDFLGATFGLSSDGQTVSLLNNAQTEFIASVDFRPAETGVSLGRIPDGTGDFFPNVSPSFGQDNSAPQLSPLVFSEIMYHPYHAPLASENVDLEFIEIYNRSNSTVINTATATTSTWRFRRDLDFNLPAFSLGAGQYLLVVPFATTDAVKVAAFNSHYGVSLASLNVTGNVVGGYNVGVTGDNLSNRRAVIELREQVDINDTAIEDLQSVTRDLISYEDRDDWSLRADGLGSSLDRIDLDGYGNDPKNWRGSYDFKGSPGTAGTSVQDVVINEVLAHTDAPFKDTIELFNTTGSSIDIGGWYLTDDFTILNKYQIPFGTTLPGNGYMAFDDDAIGFSINGAKGEELWLSEASGGTIIRFADEVSFGASFNPESFGRWPNGSGELFPMSDGTLNSTSGLVYFDGVNSGPIIEDITAPDANSFSARVIISEIMYNADRGDVSSDYQIGLDNFEYVELYNRTNTAISLGQREDNIADDGMVWTGTPQGWRLNTAVDYEFPCLVNSSACTIGAFETVLVVGFDPLAEPSVLAAFRARYGLGNSVKIFGPFQESDSLDDNAAVLELEAPDSTPGGSTFDEAFTPNILVDRVSYENSAPWPAAADGANMSLTRTAPNAFGDFAASWTAASPTPGSVPGFDGPRVLDVIVSSSLWSAGFLNQISSNPARQGYSFANATSQSTPLPWASIDAISIVFDADVDFQSQALKIRGVNTPNYTVGNNPTYNAATNTATWSIAAGSISNDRVILDLDVGKVTDASTTVHLDGEWTDGSGASQSGDGSPGGDFQFRFNVLAGDFDLDGDVQNDDFLDLVRAMFSSTGEVSYSVEADANGSGKVTMLDLLIARRRIDSSLPGGVPNSPQAPASLITPIASGEDSSQQEEEESVNRDLGDVDRNVEIATQAEATVSRRSPSRASRASVREIHQAVDRVYDATNAATDDTLRSHRVRRSGLRHRLRTHLAADQDNSLLSDRLGDNDLS